MNETGFWDAVLEEGETLLWAGRPKPRLHWRNWRLYGPAPMASAGLLSAAWFILKTSGSAGDMWLLILPALLLIIPFRATRQQLRSYAATRYALTDRRALMFYVSDDQTRIKAYPRSTLEQPQQRMTSPPSIMMPRRDTAKARSLGFEYIQTAQDLLPHLAPPP